MVMENKMERNIGWQEIHGDPNGDKMVVLEL